MDRLEEAERKKKARTNLHNTSVCLDAAPHTRLEKNQKHAGVGTDKRGQKGNQASELGLVASWSFEFGYITIHDPTTGERHDLPTTEAPGWAKREAFKRKDLWRSGNKRAYWLTAGEMEEIWEREQVEMWDSPWRPADARDGMVYEDSLGEED